MTGYFAETSIGRVVADEVDTIWHPRTPRENSIPIVLLHGQGNSKGWIDVTAQKTANRLACGLNGLGFAMVSAEMHGDAWGNDTSIPDIPKAASELRLAYPTLHPTLMILLGMSMGAGFGTRYVQLFPDSIAAMVGLIPAYDPKACYIYSNVGDAAMQAAWGFSGLANFPSGLDLASHSADAVGVPLWTGYSSDDPVIPKQSIIDYHTAVEANPDDLHDLGAHAHTIDNTLDFVLPSVAKFLVAHGA